MLNSVWGAVPLKVVWKPVRKVPDLRHSISMTKMSVIYTAWTFSRTCFFFFFLNLSSYAHSEDLLNLISTARALQCRPTF